jgi:hypothetical protein
MAKLKKLPYTQDIYLFILNLKMITQKIPLITNLIRPRLQLIQAVYKI